VTSQLLETVEDTITNKNLVEVGCSCTTYTHMEDMQLVNVCGGEKKKKNHTKQREIRIVPRNIELLSDTDGTGCWGKLKAVRETLDSAQTIFLHVPFMR
jgi:hypothetical protein